MASFNRVIIMGNITRDIELRHVGNNTAVCDLSLAVNDRRKNQSGEWIEEVAFVDVTAWGRTAEIANEYLSKGSSVLVEGKLKQETWVDKDSGKNRSKLKVLCEKLTLLGTKRASESQYTGPAKSQAATQDDNDVPF